MKYFAALIIVFFAFTAAFAQNEQSPIVEKAIDYKDWTYKNIRTDGETNLRSAMAGGKLVMVVYFAPWCPNWKHDVAFVQSLNEKYADKGLQIIGVGEYDSITKMKAHLDLYKITFPTVYESHATSARLTTAHYTQRTEAGDKRKWGSPWYVFLEPSTIEKTGDTLSKKPAVVNGELIKEDAEKYVQEKLGIAATDKNDSFK